MRSGAKARIFSKVFAKLTRKSAKRRLLRYGLLSFYAVLLGATLLFVLRGSASDNQTLSISSASALSPTTTASTDPLDQLSSVDIALQVAQLDHMPEAVPVRDQVDSQQAELATVGSSSGVAAKSQVVSSAFISNQDIKTYIAKAGDTVSGVAAKFNITSNSVLWSNNLSGQNLNAGQKLLIPPVSGIVYTVKSSDTVASLAQTYNARQDEIIADNNAEISGIHAGEQIIIPDGQEPAVSNYVSNFTAIFGGNGYDFGFCTWYVATQISVPSNWGNAVSWAYYARLSGWTVSSTPVAGAIAQTPYSAGGEGHVAVVDNVETVNGQVMIQYRDMNGIAGWDRVGYSGWVPASAFPNYIYH